MKRAFVPRVVVHVCAVRADRDPAHPSMSLRPRTIDGLHARGTAIVGEPAAQLMRLAAGVLIFAAGRFLLRDAMTYALYPVDLASGRPSGCFTRLDLLLGIGPSEGRVFAGTRLIEVIAGASMLLLGLVYFLRNFWRSRAEVVVLGAAAAYGLWHLGRAAFWSFHDADVFLTWQIIGNTPNDFAERMSSALILAFGLAAFAAAYRVQRLRKVMSLRVLAYAAATIIVVGIWSLRSISFPSAWIAMVIALVAPVIPLFMASIRHFGRG